MFTFCPNCGFKLENQKGRLINCKHCGFHFYIPPALTNAAILKNRKGEILLVKRKFDPKKDWWDLPGGFVEFDENLKKSASREIKEELGIEIKNLKYFTSTVDRYLYKNINYHTVCAIFTAQADDKKIKASDDVKEAKFFKKEDLPFEKIAFAGIKKALKDYSISPLSSSEAIT